LDVSEHRAGPPMPRPPARDAIVAGIVGIAFVVGLVWWARSGGESESARGKARADRTVERRATPYVGERACRECHPGETAAHSRSGHARTLRPAAAHSLARWMDGRRVADPEYPGVSWTYSLKDDRLAATRFEKGKSERLLLDYAFGSGHHATTFVTLTNPDQDHPVAREHRMTYLASTESLGVTPGQSGPTPSPGTTAVGRVLSSPESLHCFDCHTTRTSAQGQTILDAATMMPNVSCERCHGPGRSHVEAARRGAEDLTMPFGSGRETAAEQMRLCGHCHRHPDQSPPGRIRPDNPEIVRFQPVGLMQSACFTKSQGALSCVTCHDPHARSSSDSHAYETNCLSCHRAPQQTACPVSPEQGCIKCHMPREDAGQGVLFTDHWIRVRGKGTVAH
jgi:hypothetical protein